MQVIWCLKFCNMKKSGGTIPPIAPPRSKFWGSCFPLTPVIYAHGWHAWCFAVVWQACSQVVHACTAARAHYSTFVISEAAEAVLCPLWGADLTTATASIWHNGAELLLKQFCVHCGEQTWPLQQLLYGTTERNFFWSSTGSRRQVCFAQDPVTGDLHSEHIRIP